MVKVAVVVLLTLFATGAADGALSEETPAEFANRFYHAYGALRVRGIPNEPQRRALSPFFARELRDLLAKVDQRREPPGTKRLPLGRLTCEGDLFTSNSAGYAETYAIGFPHPTIGRLILPIHLADAESGDAWVDQLILHHGHGRWLIADIVFTDDQRNRLFGKRNLRRVLKNCLRR